MDGNYLDTSGNGLNGTGTYLGTYNRKGINNRAMVNGSNNYCSVSDNDLLSFVDGTNDLPFSISIWVKRRGNIGGIFSKSISTSEGEYYLYFSNVLYFRVVDNDTSAYLQAYNIAIPLNTWTHIVATYDGSKSQNGLNVYINGINAGGTKNIFGIYFQMRNTGLDLNIGRRGSLLDADLDDARLYNRVLTSDEIEDLYLDNLRLATPVLAVNKNSIQFSSIQDLSGNNEMITKNKVSTLDEGILFNQNGSQIALPSSVKFTGPFTIHCVFISLDNITTLQDIFGGRHSGASTSKGGINLFIYSSKYLIAEIYTIDSKIFTNSAIIPLKDNKYVCTIRYDGNNFELFINGNLSHNNVVINGSITGSNEVGDIKIDWGSYNAYLGKAYRNQFKGIIYEFLPYNKSLSDQEIFDYHKKWVIPTLTLDPNRLYDVVGNPPSEWEKGTGDYSVDEINSTNNSQLSIGTKINKCISSGTMYYPQPYATGTWYLEAYRKNSTSTQATFGIISSINTTDVFVSTRYILSILGTEGVNLKRVNNLFDTGSNFLELEKDYDFLIQRLSSPGEFPLLPGQSYSVYTFAVWYRETGSKTWILIPVILGSNPVLDSNYTTSKYTVAYLNSGDSFKGFYHWDGLFVP